MPATTTIWTALLDYYCCLRIADAQPNAAARRVVVTMPAAMDQTKETPPPARKD